MTIQIATSNQILIDGKFTGLCLAQSAAGTIVYTPEGVTTKYFQHAMPHARYSAAHDNPRALHATPELTAKFKTAGRAQLEADVLALLKTL